MEETLIIGAGPVGQASALFLNHAGKACRIIEKAEEINPHSRAILINSKTLELFDECGFTDKLLARGSKIVALNMYRDDHHLVRVPFDVLPSKFNFGLGLEQNHTEELLQEELQRRGINVERGTAFKGLELLDDGVKVKLESGEKEEEVTARRVIGADGSRSLVREALGIDFPGKEYAYTFHASDVMVSSKLPLNEVHIFYLKNHVSLYIPIREGKFRLVSTIESLDHSTSSLFQIDEVLWESSFKISCRLAESFQKGSGFLIGDAAHIHSPAGGRGMNLGIEDAWVLVDALQKGTLDQFTDLRRGKSANILKQTDVFTKMLFSENSGISFLRRRVIPYALRIGPLRTFMITNNMGLR